MPTIITENDESAWEDETGVLYHFPKRYAKYLELGTEVIYYKGKLKNTDFRKKRLTDEPHYFAKAIISNVYPDKRSEKGDLFATISDYCRFSRPVLAKIDGSYLEEIPASRKSNYWRDGVRPVERQIVNKILSALKPNEISEPESDYSFNNELNDDDNSLESKHEGKATSRYVTTYERNPKYRKQAIAIHGDSCIACGFNFGKVYGSYAQGFIHVHHIEPVSEFDAPKRIDPEKDLVPLCANCHSVVHRKKSETLSIEKLKELIKASLNQ